MEASVYVVALGCAVLLSLGLVVCETPVNRLLRNRGVRLRIQFDGATVLLAVVLVFDLAAFILLVSSAVLPR